MVATRDMTEADLLHADQVIENAFKFMEDIISDPSAVADIPNQATIELTPIAEDTGDEQVAARTGRFAIRVIATP